MSHALFVLEVEMNRILTVVISMVVLICVPFSARAARGDDQSNVPVRRNAGTITKTESFDHDPGWDGVRNHIELPVVRKQQDFGYQTSHHAGAAAGEIGGTVWRSTSPAYYGKRLKPLTFEDTLQASGTVAVTQSETGFGWQTGSTVFVGFFNHQEQGWRPVNFIGFRLETHTDTDSKKLEKRPAVEISYGTSRWAAGGVHVNTVGLAQQRNVKQLDQDALRRVPPDGSRHTWEFRYVPKEDGSAEFIFAFDGIETRMRIGDGHRRHGATFDRFGIFNNPLPGSSITAYFDDITVNGEVDDFGDDPGWDEKGNRDLIEDKEEYGSNDYGYSATNYAGGEKPGELGGRFFSVDPWERKFQGYCGDRVGTLTMNDKLVARGKFATKRFSTDSTFALGWFNSNDQGYPIKNFVGVFFDSYSNVGRIAAPLYGTSEGQNKHDMGYVTFLPDGTSYDWRLEYDPDAAGGQGAITFAIGGQELTAPLKEGDKAKGARMDRFGVFNLGWANSKHCVVYLDDLSYTAAGEGPGKGD
jgi:hypothetical protein